MHCNLPNYKLMQQKHAVCCRYQNSCNWHEHCRGHWQNSGFINNLASEVGVIRLWDSMLALYTYRFSRFDMFVHYFVNYFVRLRTNHYTLLTMSTISFIDSARNLTRNFPYLLFSWLYTYRFSHFDMFVHYFVNYFVRLRTNHYILLTISPISFIFHFVRKLTKNFPYLLFDVSWKYRLSGENGETRDEKNDWRNSLQNAIYTLIVSLVSPTFFSRSRQFDDKCKAGFSLLRWLYTYHFSCFDMFVHYFVNYFVRLRTNHYTLLTISPISFIFDSARNLTRNFLYPIFSLLYTYHFSHFDRFVYYFVTLQTNHYTLLTISTISFIFDSVRNLTRNFLYLLLDILWKYQLSGENGETRDEKNDWRDGLQNAIYTIIVSLVSPTFFRILVNLTISVKLAFHY